MSTSRTRVKICGITNVEDAQAAAEYGADALGFIFVNESPRYLTLEKARSITGTLPPFVVRVGVYADVADFYRHSPDFLDACQYYSDESHLQAGQPSVRWIQAVRVRDRAQLYEGFASITNPSAILLDAYHPDKLGGSGETFNWDLAVAAKERFGLPIILAGGLTPENVGEAVRRVRPYAVDVSSGVETSPGRKDYKKVKAFIEAVRAANA